MDESDVYRLLKEQIKDTKEKEGRKIYNIVCQEERQKAKQDFRMFSIGRRHPANPPLSTKYVILLEETGAGKTTNINSVVNYLFGVKFDDPFRLEVEEKIEDGRLETATHTDIKTVYTVHYQEGMKHKYNFVFIVTPGLADTKEQEQRQVIMQILQTFASDFGVGYLNCLGIITKGNKCILTDFQKNLPEEIKPDLKIIVSAPPAQDTESPDAVVRDTEISFRIKSDNGCPLSPQKTDDMYDPRNQWKKVTEEYDTFINALIARPSENLGSRDEKEEELERGTHVHYCKECNKICWTCSKKNCMIVIPVLHTALTVGHTVSSSMGLVCAAAGTVENNAIVSSAASLGAGIFAGIFTYIIGHMGNAGRRCNDSQCNHPLSRHVKKPIKGTKRTQDNEIIDEDIKKKRSKPSPENPMPTSNLLKGNKKL
ncbi:uncharacterized protein LOC127000416 isoform X1 [Eriocheir sinensis]|uniref:uncharacterized protein LOC127000416 isoform X1 n=1 Tax=Eriocheir sinensis TaxID=95602 RepID=UPI0021C68F75|nr:uncharacterized protein LOC127000416 isoform X1 [Eriocheir sinensis]